MKQRRRTTANLKQLSSAPQLVTATVMKMRKLALQPALAATTPLLLLLLLASSLATITLCDDPTTATTTTTTIKPTTASTLTPLSTTVAASAPQNIHELQHSTRQTNQSHTPTSVATTPTAATTTTTTTTTTLTSTTTTTSPLRDNSTLASTNSNSNSSSVETIIASSADGSFAARQVESSELPSGALSVAAEEPIMPSAAVGVAVNDGKQGARQARQTPTSAANSKLVESTLPVAASESRLSSYKISLAANNNEQKPQQAAAVVLSRTNSRGGPQTAQVEAGSGTSASSQLTPAVEDNNATAVKAAAEARAKQRQAEINARPFDPIIVCYLGSWATYRPNSAKFTPDNIDPFLCTHLVYAFAGLSNKLELKPFDTYNDITLNNYRKFTSLKKLNKQLKTLIAVGGWNEGSARFSKLVASPEARANFIATSIRFLREHKFDGLDLDWEYPAARDGSHSFDKQNYALFIQELRAAFEKEHTEQPRLSKLLLSIAVPAGKDNIDSGFDVPTISKNVDFMNVLSYDYFSSLDATANHHSPLGLSKRLEATHDVANKRLNVKWTIDYYIEQGALPGKLIVGIPTYGRSFSMLNDIESSAAQNSATVDASLGESVGYGAPTTGPGDEGQSTREKGYLAYYEICQRLESGGWVRAHAEKDAQGPVAYSGGSENKQWVAYDDVDSVIQKTNYVINNRLGGVMVWALDNDDFRATCSSSKNVQSPLVTAIRDTIIASVAKDMPPLPTSTTSTTTTTTTTSTTTTTTTTTPAPPAEELVASSGDNRQQVGSESSISTSSSNGGASLIKNLAESSRTAAALTTPEPSKPFTCQDEGFFANQKDCRNYYWCLDSGPANLGIVAHSFTCPSGLHFNPGTEGCDYPEKVGCKSKRDRTSTTTSTTTTTTSTTQRPQASSSRLSNNNPGSATASSETHDSRNRVVIKKKKPSTLLSTTSTTTTTTSTTTTPKPQRQASATTTTQSPPPIQPNNDSINELVESMMRNPQFAAVINNHLKNKQLENSGASENVNTDLSRSANAVNNPLPAAMDSDSSAPQNNNFATTESSAAFANDKQAQELLQLLTLIQSLGGVEKIAPILAERTASNANNNLPVTEFSINIPAQQANNNNQLNFQLDNTSPDSTGSVTNQLAVPPSLQANANSIASLLQATAAPTVDVDASTTSEPTNSMLSEEVLRNLARLESIFASTSSSPLSIENTQPLGDQQAAMRQAQPTPKPTLESFTASDARFSPSSNARNVESFQAAQQPRQQQSLVRARVPDQRQQVHAPGNQLRFHSQPQVQPQFQRGANAQEQRFSAADHFLPYLEGDVRQPHSRQQLLPQHQPQRQPQRQPQQQQQQQTFRNQFPATAVQQASNQQTTAQQQQTKPKRPPKRDRTSNARVSSSQAVPRTLVLLTNGPPPPPQSTRSELIDNNGLLSEAELEAKLRQLEAGGDETVAGPQTAALPIVSTNFQTSSDSAANKQQQNSFSANANMNLFAVVTPSTTTQHSPSLTASATSTPSSHVDSTTARENAAVAAATREFLDNDGPGVSLDTSSLDSSQLTCNRRGVFAHPTNCGRFIVCAPNSRSQRSLRPFVHHCPAGQIFSDAWGRCRPKSLQADWSKLCGASAQV